MSTQLLMIVLIALGVMLMGTMIGLILVARQRLFLQEQIDGLKAALSKKSVKSKKRKGSVKRKKKKSRD